MTPELHSTMLAWLDSEDATRRQHAERRLAMPDAVEFEQTGRDTTAHHPSLAAMAGSAISTAVDFAASGFALADAEEVERRLVICRGCERFDAARERCSACGCFMNGKARIAAAVCPLPEPKW